MSIYKRVCVKSGTYFFTLVTYKRKPVFAHEENILHLKKAFSHVNEKHPFAIKAIVILPDHIHTIWTLPKETSDYSTRWRLIKHFFSCQNINSSDNKIWQPRFWEHLIRNEDDLKNHIDYIHFNPVKHSLVTSPIEWQHSTFKSFFERGLYEENWGIQTPLNIKNLHIE